jgi:anthranilate phosphoribosyltransferase
VVLNAGAALAVHAAGGGGHQERLAEGILRAAEALDSGRASATLDRWVEVSASV